MDHKCPVDHIKLVFQEANLLNAAIIVSFFRVYQESYDLTVSDVSNIRLTQHLKHVIKKFFCK